MKTHRIKGLAGLIGVSILALTGCANQTATQLVTNTSNTSSTNSTTHNSLSSDTATSVTLQKVTLERIQIYDSGMTLYTTHGNMQTAYQNPRIENGQFKVRINMDLGSHLILDKEYTTTSTKNEMSYILTKNGGSLLLTVSFRSNSPTNVKTGIGFGDEVVFTFS